MDTDKTLHEDIAWLHVQLSGYANGLSDIYHRICMTIQRLQDDKTELQNRVEELEQHNPTAELRRLREENASLRAKLATAAKEKTEVTRERDVLLRKLNGVKQLIDGPEVPQFDERAGGGSDVHNTEPGPSTASSTVRFSRGVHDLSPSQNSAVTTEVSSPVRTEVSEPITDVTVVHDAFGRVIRPSSQTESTSGPSEAAQPLSTHSSATLIDTHHRPQEAPTTLGAPFVDARTASLASTPQAQPTLPTLSADPNGSPMRRPPSAVRVMSLNASPGMSEGLSVQYDDTPRSDPSGVVMVQKWRIHFAKPPTTAVVATKVKPVTMAALVQKLELDEEVSRSIEDLSLIPAGSLRLYISDTLGLAFLYDPILLESAVNTFVVEWGEVMANQNSRTYITNATEKHTELHTFIYAPRKDGWHYLGQQCWNVVVIRSFWDALALPAQRALAARRSRYIDPKEITQGLKRGQIEQLTIELQPVSRGEPNAEESALMTKLGD
ncbi:hypothetical protein BJV78DRAFT_1232845 [Lactifluus subvellereus]|nr:hypothetical protein BJV78DRAFT_1232845 [Lactifluus subvellereus]